jgi:UDP-3-O-[3-hydroxymyristoyl] glucosamine N-acyltransferase
MADPVFFPVASAISLAEIAELASCPLPQGADPTRLITGAAPLEHAGPDAIAYMDNPRYVEALAASRAGCILVSRKFAASVPDGSVALILDKPYPVFAAVLSRLYPDALRPGSLFATPGIAPGSVVHPDAQLESGVRVDPGAVIGPHAEIGAGSVIAANAVIGPHVKIGRDCSIGPNTSVVHALIGNRVILHAGVRVGQDGFGFAMGAGGHTKVPQIGRVIIQDGVEIGANSTIDRGASRDTVIGEGTKIDNLVQIAHNVVIGRHCVIVAQTGISGSTTLEDYVVLGGQVGSVGHVTIGMGAQIAASSNINSDVPPGARWGGTPAKPVRDWFREMTTLKALAARKSQPSESAGATRKTLASRADSSKDDTPTDDGAAS